MPNETNDRFRKKIPEKDVLTLLVNYVNDMSSVPGKNVTGSVPQTCSLNQR